MNKCLTKAQKVNELTARVLLYAPSHRQKKKKKTHKKTCKEACKTGMENKKSITKKLNKKPIQKNKQTNKKVKKRKKNPHFVIICTSSLTKVFSFVPVL